MSTATDQIRQVYGVQRPRVMQRRPVNVGARERVGSAAFGAIMASYGIGRRSAFGLALTGVGGALLYRGITGHCHGYEALGINTARGSGSSAGVRAQQGLRCEEQITIGRPADDLYRAWRKLENLPKIMDYVESVTPIDDQRSHWVARAPGGQRLEWDAEIINDEENRLIAWQSLPGSLVDTAGSVRFDPAPGDRGTVVTVSAKYDPPGGKAAAWIAELFDVGLERRLTEDLQRFKQLMETDAASTAAAQPSSQQSGSAAEDSMS